MARAEHRRAEVLVWERNRFAHHTIRSEFFVSNAELVHPEGEYCVSRREPPE
jgi:hypothetical protein